MTLLSKLRSKVFWNSAMKFVENKRYTDLIRTLTLTKLHKIHKKLKSICPRTSGHQARLKRLPSYFMSQHDLYKIFYSVPK